MSELRALLVTPLSGPLARFGRTTATALGLWAAEAANLPPPWRCVRLDLHAAHPDLAAVMRRGLATRPHLIFGPYGSRPTIEALRTTERVVWNHGGASSKIRWPDLSGAVNVLAPACTYFDGALGAVRSVDPEKARHVVILYATTAFGSDVARGAAERAVRLGFEVSATSFPSGRAARAASKIPDADILLVAGSFDDEIEASCVLLGREWRAVGFVGAGVEEVLSSLGPAREGLLGPAQWMAAAAPEPDEGPDVHWFLRRYQEVAGNNPPYPAAQAFAAGVLAARCLRDTQTLEDAAQLAAVRHLACRTLYGDFRLDAENGLQVGHQVITVQWQGGRRRVVWPPKYAERPLVYPRSPPGFRHRQLRR